MLKYRLQNQNSMAYNRFHLGGAYFGTPLSYHKSYHSITKVIVLGEEMYELVQ